jgi:hypothetical protein
MIRMMLREAIDDAGAGAALEAEELAAKVAYEKAKVDLEKWDVENAKRTALMQKAAAVGIKIGDNKASRELRQQPEFNYDAKVLQTKRSSLEDKLEKAQEEYGTYAPSAVGFKRVATGGSRTTADAQKPDPNARVYMSIDQVKPLQWYDWNDPRWARTVGKIAYGSSKEKSGEEAAGTGPGEERLAVIFGGKVQGGGVSFDVVTPDGRRWEVKALDTASTLIRPGTEGRAAFERPRVRLERIIKQLRNFSIVAGKLGHELLATSKNDVALLKYVEGFVSDELPMLSKGEIPSDRFRSLRAVLKSLAELRNRWNGGNQAKQVNTTIGLANQKIDVDKPTFIDVAKRVQRAKPDIDVLSNFEERELALASLKDDAFEHPDNFFNEWFDSIDVMKVFEQVDGVFIVNQTGFIMVPKPLFKKAFRFKRVSQGVPRFGFMYYGGTTEK